MDLHFSFKEMRTSPAIREYAREKSERLMKYFQGRISVNWNFSAGGRKQLKVAHCHLLGDHMDYFGHAETEDLRASIDEVIDKIERQLRKHKEIVRDHLHRRARRAPRVSRASRARRGAASE